MQFGLFFPKISYYQHLSDKEIFSVAKELAIAFNQESVVVFIPGQDKIGNVVLKFTSLRPNIKGTVSLLQEKLPAIYSQAFSLHLANKCNEFSQAKVTEVEWLGDKINPEKIKKEFPHESISYHYGRVFFIYKDGRIQQI